MAVSYRKLWHLMLDMKLTKSGLEKKAGISHHAMLKMTKDQDVSTDVLTKISGALGCEVSDIVDLIPDASDKGDEGSVEGEEA